MPDYNMREDAGKARAVLQDRRFRGRWL